MTSNYERDDDIRIQEELEDLYRMRDQEKATNTKRPPTMEQDERVIKLARKIFIYWMNDPRWNQQHLEPPRAYFWAELAAKVILEDEK